MSAVTQWFEIDKVRPCQYGVYELEEKSCYLRVYSLFDGEWRTAHYSIEKAFTERLISGAVRAGSYRRWRGLSEKPE